MIHSSLHALRPAACILLRPGFQNRLLRNRSLSLRSRAVSSQCAPAAQPNKQRRGSMPFLCPDQPRYHIAPASGWINGKSGSASADARPQRVPSASHARWHSCRSSTLAAALVGCLHTDGTYGGGAVALVPAPWLRRSQRAVLLEGAVAHVLPVPAWVQQVGTVVLGACNGFLRMACAAVAMHAICITITTDACRRCCCISCQVGLGPAVGPCRLEGQGALEGAATCHRSHTRRAGPRRSLQRVGSTLQLWGVPMPVNVLATCSNYPAIGDAPARW